MKHISEEIDSLYPPETQRHRDACRKANDTCAARGLPWRISSHYGIAPAGLFAAGDMERLDIEAITHVVTLALGGDAFARKSVNLGFYANYREYKTQLEPMLAALQKETWFNPHVPYKEE